MLLLDLHSVNGQLSIQIGYRQSTITYNTEVPIFSLDPSVSGFSTVEFSKRYPGSSIIPENLYVNYPEMPGAIDTVVILWYLKPEYFSEKGEVNIILVGINPDSSKKFYIDNNNDRTFSTNEDAFVFRPDIKEKFLEIKILGSYYNYTLLNPDYSKPVEPPSRTKEYYNNWHMAGKKPSINFDLAILAGQGKAALFFNPTEGTIDTYKYYANIFGSMRPTLSLDFSWLNFHLGFSGSFERLQYDETIRYGYNDAVPEPVRNYDSGIWMTKKIDAGISAEYDFGLFKRFWISPFWSYHFAKNTDNAIFDKQWVPPVDAKYKDMHSTEYGLKLKFPVSGRTLLYVKGTYMRTWFDASEFLPEYESGSYSVDYKQAYIGMGVQYRLFKN